MRDIHLTIDDINVCVPKGSTLLEAARSVGIEVPTLCHIKDLHEGAVCRVCVVEDDAGQLLTACDTAVADGMVIRTNTVQATNSRKMTLSLMCENHRMDCDNCPRYHSCEFHKLCSRGGINTDEYETFRIQPARDTSSLCIVRDTSKCVLCRRCIAACEKQGLSLISVLNRGTISEVGTALPTGESGCIGCGQCAAHCPTAALQPVDGTKQVWNALLKKKVAVAAVVSAEAAKTLGECFHESVGSTDEGKLPAMLRKVGFDKVYAANAFDSEYAKELADEFAGRGESIISGNCPGIKNYLEKHEPDKLKMLAKIPSPLAMLTNAVRSKNPQSFIVYIGGCTAMKNRCEEAGLNAVLTVSEIAAMIDRACVSRATALNVWHGCEKGEFDRFDGKREVEKTEIPYKKVTGLCAFREIIDKKSYTCVIIKAYACPDGCLCGGGQPRLNSKELSERVCLSRC